MDGGFLSIVSDVKCDYWQTHLQGNSPDLVTPIEDTKTQCCTDLGNAATKFRTPCQSATIIRKSDEVQETKKEFLLQSRQHHHTPRRRNSHIPSVLEIGTKREPKNIATFRKAKDVRESGNLSVLVHFHRPIVVMEMRLYR